MSKIKRFVIAILVLILMAIPLIPAKLATAAGPNLISNPSLETTGTKPTAPLDWSSNSWGINTAKFEYLTTGHTGSKSVKTTLSNYVAGDAKWYFKPVAVTAGKKYTYSTFYQSNVTSEVIIQVTLTNGLVTYYSLKKPAASAATWAQTTVDYTLPTGAKTASIYHVINKNGWLQLDDAYFGLTDSANTPVAPTVSITSPIANATVSGVQTISATAASTGSTVAGVQFKLDGANLGTEDTVAPYSNSLDTKTISNGVHTLSAVARSANGLSTTSSTVSFTVNNVADPVAPSVNITSPTAGTTISGTKAITATAASTGSTVAGVQFKLDGANLGTEVTSAPYTYSWDSTKASDGVHSLTAVVRSANGLSTTSSSVNVTVSNPAAPVAPTVSITAPSANTTVSGAQTVTATAASTGSTVAGVQFKLDGANLGTEVTSAPYTYSWDTTTATNGNHTLSAVVRSANGLSTTSTSVTVNINNVVTPPVDTENLIGNNSMETGTTTPIGWYSNSWGTNSTSFTYNTTGRTGSRSLTTTIASATDGDAKWYFEPVNVVAGKTYLYRDYYKSNIDQRVVVAFIDAAGNYTYKELAASAASAASWAQYQDSFVAPTGAVKATVFHLIDKTGSLTIDDALLQVAPSAPAAETVPNGSAETGTTAPTGWTSSSWGSNTAAFQYVTNDGYTGSKSLKVTVSNYVDGDAKWYFNPIKTLTPGKQYRFTGAYKGNVTPHVVAMFIKADGTEQYFGLPSPLLPASSTWQTYSDTFSVPLDAVSVSVFMYVAQNGSLQVDNFGITDYQSTGFNRPLLTLTFDDGHEDNVTTALPILTQYGFKSTQCYATTFIEGNTQAVNDLLKFKNAGHEICSHTVSHPMLTTLNAANLDYELKHSKEYLESISGQPVVNFASPFGDYNGTVNNAIDDYYGSHRTVDEGYNSKDNFNPYRIRVQNILDTTSANQVAAWIAQAQHDNTWLVLVYHRVAADAGPYDSFPADFAQQMAAVKASGITVKTMQDALTEVRSQL